MTRVSGATWDETHLSAEDLIRRANSVVRSVAPQLNDAQRQIALAIGDFETGFGVSGSWVTKDGVPSYNWGGLVGTGTAGSISHGDLSPVGAPVTYGFMAFNTMEEAFAAFMRTWARSDTLQAAAEGDALAVARCMCTHAYFGGVKGSADDRAQLYGKGILSKAKGIASALGESLYVDYDSTQSLPLSGDRCDSTVTREEPRPRIAIIPAIGISVLVALGVSWLVGKK